MFRQSNLLALCVAVYSLFIYNGFNTAGSLTGIYRDNGYQTAMESQLSAKELNKLEKDILIMFGVPVQHKKLPRNMHGSATQFLFDIYKSIELGNSNNRKTREISNIGQYDDDIVLDSDVILTLYLSKHLNNIRHEHGKRIVFELKDIPCDGSYMITSAIVHLYQSNISNTSNTKMYSVTLYQILLSENGEKKLEFVDAQNTTIDYDGWLYFNATGTLISWTLSATSNKGFYVSVYSLDNKDNEINPEEIGIITWTENDESLESKKPFMAVYLKSNIGGNQVLSPPVKKLTRKRRKENIENRSNKSNPFKYPEDKIYVRSCQKEILYVSFKDLEWQEWIIAPDGYGAYYCTGECNFPLTMNATNHAILQTLMHLMSPLDIPKACCVPTKMTHQSVLFFLEDNNVILKKYKNMIVKSCGCH